MREEENKFNSYKEQGYDSDLDDNDGFDAGLYDIERRGTSPWSPHYLSEDDEQVIKDALIECYKWQKEIDNIYKKSAMKKKNNLIEKQKHVSRIIASLEAEEREFCYLDRTAEIEEILFPKYRSKLYNINKQLELIEEQCKSQRSINQRKRMKELETLIGFNYDFLLKPQLNNLIKNNKGSNLAKMFLPFADSNISDTKFKSIIKGCYNSNLPFLANVEKDMSGEGK